MTLTAASAVVLVLFLLRENTLTGRFDDEVAGSWHL
jgi:hypothetical protein